MVAALFQPSPPGAVPAPTVGASPARRLRDAVEPLAMHAVWCRATNEALAAEGLDFFGAYLWGRAAALGEDPEPAVVAATFAAFEPQLVGAVLAGARAACPRRRVLKLRSAQTSASLDALLAGEDVAPVADALAAALAGLSRVGRPLFAGLAAQPWPTSPAGRLWRACELLREHRGDAHVAVWATSGLDAVTMNVLTELWLGMPLGSYSATRGFGPDAIAGAVAWLEEEGLVADGALTDVGRRRRDELERRTDDAEAALVAALGDQVDGLVERLDAWSATCIEAKAFPPDAFKRAAG